MDFRIGAKSPVYSARQTSKVADKQLKQSFAMKMAEVRPPRQDTVEISGNPLAQRLENVHQQINGMDLTGKTSEEVYKSILDAYEDEFGFSDLLFYIDEDAYNMVDEDRQKMLESTVPDYQKVRHGLHYRAMGYDKMTDAEKIAAIKERVGGNSYVHKYCEIAELMRADVLTPTQGSEICNALSRKAEKEYCAKIGIDHVTLYQHLEEYYGQPFEKALETWSKGLLDWKANTDITWLEIVESVEKYSTKPDLEKDAFMKEFEETSELLTKSDKA